MAETVPGGLPITGQTAGGQSTPPDVVGVAPFPFTLQRALALLLLWGLLAVAAETESIGDIAVALAVLIAGTVTLTWGVRAAEGARALVGK